MLRKKTFSIIVGSVLLLTVIGVYIAVSSVNNTGTTDDTNQTDVVSTAGVTTAPQTQTGKENPFGEEVKTPLSEDLIQQYIHAMSHQKVEADEKWSYFKITDERIDYLLSQLEINKYKYEHTYNEILVSWKEGDFTDAVSDHNAVWKMRNGNIGRATGLLSPKEEKKYMESQKREKR